MCDMSLFICLRRSRGTAQPDWQSAEEVLFKRSQEIIRHFVHEHPDEVFALFAYSVDAVYAGVAFEL